MKDQCRESSSEILVYAMNLVYNLQPKQKGVAINYTRQPLKQVGEIAHVHDQVSKSDFLYPETHRFP